MTFISTLLKAAAALFMLVILMLLVQLDLTAFQTVEVLAPGWGWLAFVSLLALETGAVLWLGLAWFSRAPRLVLRDDPTEAERQAFARELERRLKKNPHVRAAGLRATDEHFLEKALDVLDARAGEEIRNSAKRVFLGTALSQNGRLDALIVFVSLARMVWRVSGIYNQRPTPAELWSVYSTVSSATFISFSIEALDIPRTITESMNELLPAVTPAMAASSVPLMGPMMQRCTSAVIDGAANCLLAIRAGVVTRSAFRFAALGREEARQQACVREAGTMLAEISWETVGAIVEAFRKQLVNLPASMGQKISETVGTVADSALEKTLGRRPERGARRYGRGRGCEFWCRCRHWCRAGRGRGCQYGSRCCGGCLGQRDQRRHPCRGRLCHQCGKSRAARRQRGYGKCRQRSGGCGGHGE